MYDELQSKGIIWNRTPGIETINKFLSDPEEGFSVLVSAENFDSPVVQDPMDKLWISVPLVPTLVSRQIDRTPIETQKLSPYMISTAPPGSRVRASLQGKGLGVHLYIDRVSISEIADGMGIRYRSSTLRPVFGVVDSVMASMIQGVVYELYDINKTDQLCLSCLMRDVAFQILGTPSVGGVDYNDNQRKDGLNPKQLKLVFEYIEEELVSEIKIQKLSILVSLGRSTFIRRFKRSTGLSPYQYVIKARVRRAKHLLMDRCFGLAHIAFACGFSDQPHFTHVFRRLEGITPMQYRTSHC
ncbi:MAG: AraC family transcriptional regulator [Desulfobacteraceae bacterium]|jgi:AraC family transcriptional regulator